MINQINAVGAFLEEHTSFKKVGGLYHWRIGRIGGSLYVKKARVAKIVTKYKREVAPVVAVAPLMLEGPSADRRALALARTRQERWT